MGHLRTCMTRMGVVVLEVPLGLQVCVRVCVLVCETAC